jgi:hypothetical protein
VRRNERRTSSQRISWEFIMISFCMAGALIQHWIGFSPRVQLQQLNIDFAFVFQDIPYVGGHHCTTDIEGVRGLLVVGPYMAKVVAVVELCKASLSSE